MQTLRLPRYAERDTSARSAGGYLRGMTRSWQNDHLNLLGSLIGVSEQRK